MGTTDGTGADRCLITAPVRFGECLGIRSALQACVRKDLFSVHVGGDPANVWDVAQGREIVEPEGVGEETQLPVDGEKLYIDSSVVLGRQKEVLLFQDGANLVEGARADLLNAFPNIGCSQLAFGGALVQGEVHARMEEQPPVLEQGLRARQGGQTVGVRLLDQNDLGWELPLGVALQFV